MRLPSGPVASLVLASGLFGCAVTGTKYALGGFDPFTLLLLELMAAAGALWALLLKRGYRPPASWRLAVCLGLLEPGFAYLAETFGLAHTTAAAASIVSGLESAFVVVLAGFVLGERVRKPTVAAVGLAFAGLVVLQGGDPLGGSGLGDLYVALGVLSASSYTVVVKRFPAEPNALALTTFQFSAATVLALIVAGTRWVSTPGSRPTEVAPRFWVVAALVGVFGYAASFVIFNSVIAQLDAGPASIVLNLIPVFGVLSAVGILGESLAPATLGGALLIAVSVSAFVILESRAGAPLERVGPQLAHRPVPE